MTDDMKAIIDLQEIDLTIRRLEEQDRENNAELNRKKEESVKISETVAVAVVKERELEAQIHSKDVDRQAHTETMAKYNEQRNYIKKPRELVAIDTEIETCLKEIKLNETETHKLRKELDEFKKSLETEREKLKIKEEEISLIEQRNADQNAKSAAAVAEARSTRDQLEKKIPKELLDTYRFISSNKGGTALAEVVGEACGGCYISLPPQAVNEIRRGDRIIRCTSCARILFMKN
jgi:predicted  nucleic acid-binding Zn-ribbon protein